MRRDVREQTIARWLPGMLALAVAPSMAYAHVGIRPSVDLGHGLLHPLTGLDHLAAAVFGFVLLG